MPRNIPRNKRKKATPNTTLTTATESRTETTEDPRKGKRSASSMQRYLLCPGSFRMEQHAREGGRAPARSDDYASYGLKVHAYLSGDITAADLSPSELRTAQKADGIRHEVETAFLCDSIEKEVILERRFWHSTGEFSGQADKVIIQVRHALIIDYKALYGTVPVAATNPQLRALAALVWENSTRVEKITVAVIQPHSPSPGYTVASFDRDALAAASNEIVTMLSVPEPMLLGDGLEPGLEQCKFCDARLICNPHINHVNSLRHRYAKNITDMNAEEFVGTLNELPMLKTFIKDMEATAKEILKADPDHLHGWSLIPGRKLRNVDDIMQAWKIIGASTGLTQDEFLSCAKLQLGKLANAVAAKTGVSIANGRSHVEDQLAPVITMKQGEDMLKKAVSE